MAGSTLDGHLRAIPITRAPGLVSLASSFSRGRRAALSVRTQSGRGALFLSQRMGRLRCSRATTEIRHSCDLDGRSQNRAVDPHGRPSSLVLAGPTSLLGLRFRAYVQPFLLALAQRLLTSRESTLPFARSIGCLWIAWGKTCTPGGHLDRAVSAGRLSSQAPRRL